MNMLLFLIRLVTWMMINGQQCKRENNKKLTQLEIKDDVILTILSFFFLGQLFLRHTSFFKRLYDFTEQ